MRFSRAPFLKCPKSSGYSGCIGDYSKAIGKPQPPGHEDNRAISHLSKPTSCIHDLRFM